MWHTSQFSAPHCNVTTDMAPHFISHALILQKRAVLQAFFFRATERSETEIMYTGAHTLRASIAATKGPQREVGGGAGQQPAGSQVMVPLRHRPVLLLDLDWCPLSHVSIAVPPLGFYLGTQQP